MDSSQSTDARDSTSNIEDEGFTMTFSFDVIEDVAEQVEEMMRLGALGYFAHARAISDSIDPRHLSSFAVVAEQMRLLLDQGDYQALQGRAPFASKFAATQGSIVQCMVWLGTAGMTGPGQLDPNFPGASIDLDHAVKKLDSLFRASSDENESEQCLLQILRLMLWRITAGQKESYPFVLTEKQQRDLQDVTIALISRADYWAADKLVPLWLLPSNSQFWIAQDPAQCWPSRDTLTVILGAIQQISRSNEEGRIGRVTLAQTVCETLGSYRYIHPRNTIAAERIQEVTRALLRLQAVALADPGHEDYGPRCKTRFEMIMLDERVVDYLLFEGLPLTELDLDTVAAAQQIALEHADKWMLQIANRRCCNDTAARREYIMWTYADPNESFDAIPYARLQLKKQVDPNIGRNMTKHMVSPVMNKGEVAQIEVSADGEASIVGKDTRVTVVEDARADFGEHVNQQVTILERLARVERALAQHDLRRDPLNIHLEPNEIRNPARNAENFVEDERHASAPHIVVNGGTAHIMLASSGAKRSNQRGRRTSIESEYKLRRRSVSQETSIGHEGRRMSPAIELQKDPQSVAPSRNSEVEELWRQQAFHVQEQVKMLNDRERELQERASVLAEMSRTLEQQQNALGSLSYGPDERFNGDNRRVKILEERKLLKEDRLDLGNERARLADEWSNVLSFGKSAMAVRAPQAAGIGKKKLSSLPDVVREVVKRMRRGEDLAS